MRSKGTSSPTIYRERVRRIGNMNKVLISTLCSGKEYVKYLIGFYYY